MSVASYDQRFQQVARQWNAETINFFLDAEAARARKRWRALGATRYRTFSATRKSWDGFFQTLLIAATEAFAQESYTQFSALLTVEMILREDVSLIGFDVFAPYASFCAALDREQQRLVDMVKLFNETEAGAPEREAMREEEAERLTRFNQAWSVRLQPPESRRALCVRLVVDRSSTSATLDEAPVVSTDPADYPDHITTTSEALAYVAAKMTTSIAVTNLDWVVHNYPLMKLTAYTMDHGSIPMGQLRVNVADAEEWDFEYPAFDTEIGKYKNP